MRRHFSHTAGVQQVRAFSKWLKSHPHTHKIVIAGNHDATVERMQTIEGLAQVSSQLKKHAQKVLALHLMLP